MAEKKTARFNNHQRNQQQPCAMHTAWRRPSSQCLRHFLAAGKVLASKLGAHEPFLFATPPRIPDVLKAHRNDLANQP